MLALRSAGIGNVSDSIEWLREVQNEDGGWGDTAGSPSNADGTGAVLQVLSPSGKSAQKAVGYLRQVQQPGGGWRLGGNGALNTQSTAWAVEGLLAAGANPADFKRGGKSALEYLEGNQDADGHYRYSSKSDQSPVWVTGQVLVAAAKKYLPLEAPARAPDRGLVALRRVAVMTIAGLVVFEVVVGGLAAALELGRVGARREQSLDGPGGRLRVERAVAAQPVAAAGLLVASQVADPGLGGL